MPYSPDHPPFSGGNPPPMRGGISPQNPATRRPGVFKGLLDTRFDILVTPLLVRWIYICSVVTISMGTIFWFVFAWWVATWKDGWLWGLLGMVSAPVNGFILVLAVRVACEFVVTRFVRSR